MTEEESERRLQELRAAILARRRFTEPPAAEAHLWQLVPSVTEDDQGSTCVPTWLPAPEVEEWQRLAGLQSRGWTQAHLLLGEQMDRLRREGATPEAIEGLFRALGIGRPDPAPPEYDPAAIAILKALD